MGMTTNLLAPGTTAKLTHATTEPIDISQQRTHVAVCGRKITGYVEAGSADKVTCPKCAKA